MILFIKHISIEGPGTIGDFFEDRNYVMKTIELSDGEHLPSDLSGIEAVIVLGGPMNVYEEDKHSFLKEENIFIQKVLKENIPFLGICLGSQLLAKACNAKVNKAPVKEHGFTFVNQTEEGKHDPLFKGLKGRLMVFQWHEDTFDIPGGATLLTTSDVVCNQAVKVGRSAYGLQYHIEVDKKIIESWIKKYFKVDNASDSEMGCNMLENYDQYKGLYNSQAKQIYENFGKIIEAYSRQRTNV